MAKVYTKIDVTDGYERFLREEPTLETEDDVARLATEEGFQTGEVGWMAIGARAAGIVPEDVLSSDRVLLYSAGRAAVSQIVQRQEETVELKNGKTVKIQKYLGRPGRKGKQDDDEVAELSKPSAVGRRNGSYVKTRSAAGRERAEHYVLNVVPGHLYNRMKEIAAMNGDVRRVADGLIAEIDEMVANLT